MGGEDEDKVNHCFILLTVLLANILFQKLFKV